MVVGGSLHPVLVLCVLERIPRVVVIVSGLGSYGRRGVESLGSQGTLYPWCLGESAFQSFDSMLCEHWMIELESYGNLQSEVMRSILRLRLIFRLGGRIADVEGRWADDRNIDVFEYGCLQLVANEA